MQHEFNRRGFVKAGAIGAGTLFLKPTLGGAQEADAPKDHFFLNLVYQGGLDSRYFFDARPRALTDAKLQVNYWPDEAVSMKGANGTETWRSTITEPLMAHQGDFTVLNGVHMIVTFDGHPQNVNYLFTGSAFGGESFLPHLNTVKPLAMDVIETGGFSQAEITNSDGSIPLTAQSASQFAQRLATAPDLSAESPLGRFVEGRMKMLGKGKGGFNNASKKLLAAHRASPGLIAKVKGLNFEGVDVEANGESILTSMALIREVFKAGIATGATWVFGAGQNPPNIDTHDGTSAQAMPAVAQTIATDIASVFKFLKETPFDDTRSLFDVTTIFVSSEFSRSMRGFGEFATAGNDHNPLTNSFLIGGKGIQGGNVIGQSNFRSVAEVAAGPQGAHKALDSMGVKAMGKSFDYVTGTTSDAMPDVYKADDFLSVNALVNTIYTLFGVDEKHFRTNERSGPKTPVIQGLLA